MCHENEIVSKENVTHPVAATPGWVLPARARPTGSDRSTRPVAAASGLRWLKASSARLAVDAFVLVPILGVALAMRLVNLQTYSGLFDEGIRAEQLFLMSAGYRPFKDIFAAQGPLLLDMLHPWFVLFGQDLAAARLSVGVYSLVGLVGIYWIGRMLGGVVGGAAATLLLTMSPLYLEGSRLALAEVPAMAPAVLAVGSALCYARSGSRRWLVAAAVLLAVGLLIKPIVLAAGVPVGLAVIGRGLKSRRAWQDLVLVGAIIGVLMLLVVFAVGLAGVFEQIVAYRMESRASEGWSLWKNRLAMARGISFEQTALFGTAAIGALTLLAQRRWPLACVVAWALASVGLLLAYSPLHGKHIVVMIPPIAAVAGGGLGLAWQKARSTRRRGARLAIGGAAAALVAWYVATVPAALAQSGQLMKVTADVDVDPALEQYADAVSVIAALSAPSDFIVTDHPYLTFLAQRLVPPALVDTSKSRIRSRSLRASEATSISAAYQPRLIVLWTDRLRALRDFKNWVEDNFRLVKVYNRRMDLDRGIYARKDADLSAIRAQLAGTAMTPASDDFGGALRLAGYVVDRTSFRRGDGAGVTLEWESLAPLTVDYHVVIVLRSADGQAWDQQQESLAGGSIGTTEWEVGHWLFQNTFVRADERVPADEYTVGVSVYDSRARRLVPLPDGRDEVTIAHIAVR